MNEYLQKILDIDPNNKFLIYIVHRVTRDDYRGTHRSQHQRYDLDKVLYILGNIYELVKEDKLEVPRGDWSMQDENKMIELEEKYPRYYALVNNTGIGANSIKKHFFVDFSRAGFCHKYNKKDELIQNTEKRTSYDYIKLTKEAIKMLKARSIFLKYRIFTKGIEKMLGSSLTNLVEAIDLSELRRDRFSFEEYTLIFSDNENLDGNEKIELLREYRRLSTNGKEEVLKNIKKYCDPNRFARNKTEKRDYHNWRNETQQLFSLFKTTIYFEVFNIGGKDFFKLNTSENIGIFELRRSSTPKNLYFRNHKIQKINNYELHHIVPLSFVRNKGEYKIIDDYRNLIYIHKDKHKEIKRDFIVFKEQSPKIFFKNRFDDSEQVVAKNGENTSFNEALLKDIENYNIKLRNAIS